MVLRIAMSAALLAASIAACTSNDQPPPPEPVGPSGVSLILSDTRPNPGDLITLRVQAEGASTLGLESDLERWTGGEWKREFILLKAHGDKPATYARPGSRIDVIDIGLDGRKEWELKIPVELTSGTYRIRETVGLGPDSVSPGTVKLAVQVEIAG
jgi:hypothetical protein